MSGSSLKGEYGDHGWLPKRTICEVWDCTPAYFKEELRRLLGPEHVRRVGPRNLFYARALLDAWRDKALAKVAASSRNGDAELLVGSDSPVLDRLRLAKAKECEWDLMQKERQLLNREEAHARLVQLSSTLRACLDQLQRVHGVDALRIMEEGLDEWDRGVKEYLGSDARQNGTH